MHPVRRLSLWSLLLAATFLANATAQPRDSTSFRGDSTFARPTRHFTRTEIGRLPSRDLNNVLSLVPGITQVYGGIYARGSRLGEIEYRFGGVSVLNRWTNGSGIPLLPEMLEAIDVNVDAYGTGLGSMGGGVVDLHPRTGGDAFSAHASYVTDDFAQPGAQFLKTSSFGSTTAVVTIGGPLPFDTRFFIAGEASQAANRSPMYLSPMRYPNLVTDFLSSRPEGQPLPGPFVVEKNRVPFMSSSRNVLQFHLTSTGAGPALRMFGSLSTEEARDANWYTAVRDYFRSKRVPWNKETTTFLAAEGTHEIVEGVKARVGLSYYHHRLFTWDPDFGEDWRLYPDSAANAAKGYSGFTSRYLNYFPSYSTIYQFTFTDPSQPNSTYRKEAQDRWMLNGTASTRPSERWLVSLAGEVEWWTLRKFSVSNIGSMRSYLDTDQNGVDDRVFASEYDRRVRLKRGYVSTSFGYDVMGEPINDGYDAPRRPSTASLDLDNRVEDGPLTWRLGVRALWVSNDIPMWVPDLSNGPILGPDFDFNLNFIDESRLTRTPRESYLLPRASVEYVSDRVRFHLAGGQYVETLRQDQLQIDEAQLSSLLNPYSRVPYNLGGSLLTFPVHSSRTSHAEAGGEWAVMPGIELTASVHLKSMTDQVRMGFVNLLPWTFPYVSWVNTGQSRSTTADLGLTVHPMDELRVGLSATVAHEVGNGSSPRSNWQEVTDSPMPFPPVLFPLDHVRETQLRAELQVDGPAGSLLDGAHLWFIATARSGIPFTLERSDQFYFGSSTPWNIGVRSLIDPRSRNFEEPLNSSRTPWITTVDVSLTYDIRVGPATVTVFAFVTNLFDTKNVINVYPRTGSATTDGWLGSTLEANYKTIPMYEQFYRRINLVNRWAYVSATGNDIYGPPRQLRLGLEVGI